MNIIFEEVKWKNLLSYGNEPSIFKFSSGIDLVLGTNGQGKSTFVEAVFFSLFGKAFRKIKSGSLINRVNKKKLETEIIFKVDDKRYKIFRSQKPNKFEIYLEVEDEFQLIEQRAAVKDYQKYLEEEILNLNETIFRQLIALGSNLPSSKPFMELSQSEKEVLFQTLTDTSIFGHLKKAFKLRIQDCKSSLKELEYKREILKSSIDSEKIMIKDAEIQNENFKQHHEKNISDTKEEMAKLNENIEKFKKALEKLKELKLEYDEYQAELANETLVLNELKSTNEDKINKLREENSKEYELLLSGTFLSDAFLKECSNKEEEIFKLKSRLQEIESEVRGYTSKISFIEGAEQGAVICTECSTTNYLVDISEEEVKNKESYSKKIEDLEREKLQINTSINKLNEDLKKFKEDANREVQIKKEELQKQKTQNDKILQEKLELFSKEYEANEAKVNSIRAKAESIREKLLAGKRVKDMLQEAEDRLEECNHKLEQLDSVKLVQINYDSINAKEADFKIILDNIKTVGDDLEKLNYLENLIGGNNLKGAVIKRQIPFLNKNIQHFLELFSLLEYSFVIDENFKERLISRDTDSEFNQLSNGQKARISFSIMFAFLKLIEERNGVRTNILVLDEILDSSVDAQGREELLNILKSEFSETKDIVIISHNQEIKEKIELFDRMIHITKDKFSKLEIEEL